MNHSEFNGQHSTQSKDFIWTDIRLEETRFQKIKDGLTDLRHLCDSHTSDEEAEDTTLLDTMSDVLASLERTFIHHFQTRRGHIVSPKSSEPWD